MSKFSDLSADQQIMALRHLSIASLAATMGAFGTLIARGLISPDEFSQHMKPVMDELEKVGHADDLR